MGKVIVGLIDFKNLTTQFMSAVDAQVITTGDEIKAHVVDHIVSPVQWATIMEKLQDYDLIIEVGPGTALAGLMKDEYPAIKVISINKQADIDELLVMLGKTTQRTEI